MVVVVVGTVVTAVLAGVPDVLTVGAIERTVVDSVGVVVLAVVVVCESAVQVSKNIRNMEKMDTG